jgi:hypothetical protein
MVEEHYYCNLKCSVLRTVVYCTDLDSTWLQSLIKVCINFITRMTAWASAHNLGMIEFFDIKSAGAFIDGGGGTV